MVEVLSGQEPRPFMAFLLYPNADQPIITVVAVRIETVDEPITMDEVADVLRMPAEMLEQPADEQVLMTSAGPALRLVQRYLAAVEPGIEAVNEGHAYAWVLDDGEGPVVITLSTCFEDLVAAGQWQPCLDALAHSLRVTS